MQTEPITWELGRPKTAEDFPCTKCKKKIAGIKVSLFVLSEDPPVQVTMALCSDCASEGEDSIRQWIKERKGRE